MGSSSLTCGWCSWAGGVDGGSGHAGTFLPVAARLLPPLPLRPLPLCTSHPPASDLGDAAGGALVLGDCCWLAVRIEGGDRWWSEVQSLEIGLQIRACIAAPEFNQTDRLSCGTNLGKAIRLCFPTIKTRRLGVRGNSKYHCE